MTKTQPTIKRLSIAGVVGYELYAPDGELAATFYNEQFLRRIMEEMFDLCPFDRLPLENDNYACLSCGLIEGCHISDCPNDPAPHAEAFLCDGCGNPDEQHATGCPNDMGVAK